MKSLMKYGAPSLNPLALLPPSAPIQLDCSLPIENSPNTMEAPSHKKCSFQYQVEIPLFLVLPPLLKNAPKSSKPLTSPSLHSFSSPKSLKRAIEQ